MSRSNGYCRIVNLTTNVRRVCLEYIRPYITFAGTLSWRVPQEHAQRSCARSMNMDRSANALDLQFVFNSETRLGPQTYIYYTFLLYVGLL
jgi:hypothetical protein